MKASAPLMLSLAMAAMAAPALAKKSCEDLKMEIEARILANRVTDFSLGIIDAAETEAGAKVVGTCEGGARKIVYWRNETSRVQ